MIRTVLPWGEICTVIDEGVLNTESAAELRRYVLKSCKIIAVVNLPDETFKPNKINVKSSLLYLQKRSATDEFLEDKYNISFIHFDSLGYHGSGNKIRGFDETLFLNEIGDRIFDKDKNQRRNGYNSCYTKRPLSPMLKVDSNSIALFNDAM
jgi:type I restriction enzyme M protein